MKNDLYRGFMKVLLLIPLFLILGGLNGCINSNTESNRFDVIKVPCEITNANGVIGCGKVPISINDEVNKKLYPNCDIDFNNFTKNEKKCLEENYNRPADAYILGNLKYYGKYFTKNESEGFKLIKFSADNNNPEANAWLGDYFSKKGDIQESIKYIKIAADLGSPLGMHNLGARYIRGSGVEKNTEKALFLLNQSKEFIPASYSEIALLDLQKGDVDGFIENNNIAVEKKYWFALVDLASLYLGEMPNLEDYRDLKKADLLANKLIEHDVIVGDFVKAKVFHYQNLRTPEICKLYKNSFENGYMPAGINLGAEYLTGGNCDKNYRQALDIFLMLFNSTDKDIKVVSASNIGYMYLNGLGVPKNKIKAKEFLEIAVNGGYEPAKDMLKEL
ncbi:tetratricopeptide repeat protein [Acinetobacter guillouiae]|uniref:tetratricopeptide repeat protein n=1 Tax=Acinetobacter guillouiae TaxID=106649 RepID=UPI0021D008A2|nr:tetratricopeptide repeat protein [Acinetobacter guillouiae]